MSVLGIIQARMGSTRLPGKVVLPLAGRPVIEHVVRAVQSATTIDAIVVATTTLKVDDIIEDIVSGMGISVYRGDVTDVLARFVGAIRGTDHSVIARFTADNPLMDPRVIDAVISRFHVVDADHVSNVVVRSWPRGLDTEAVSREALMRCHDEAILPEDREHVTLYIRRNPRKYRLDTVHAPPEETWPEARLTLDTQEDYRVLARIFESLWKGVPLPVGNVVKWLRRHPEIVSLNSGVQQTIVFGTEY